eukprot:715294-Pelagomonas_calceolata.AAC.1
MPTRTGFSFSNKTYQKHTGYPCNLQIPPCHCILNAYHQTTGGRILNLFPTTFIFAHTGALRQEQPSILQPTKKTFTSKIKNWREITYTDGSIIK